MFLLVLGNSSQYPVSKRPTKKQKHEQKVERQNLSENSKHLQKIFPLKFFEFLAIFSTTNRQRRMKIKECMEGKSKNVEELYEGIRSCGKS